MQFADCQRRLGHRLWQFRSDDGTLVLKSDDELFKEVSAEHVHSMAIRLGGPWFMLHDLRKMLATVRQKLEVGDAVLRRILNHSALRVEVLNRVYVGLGVQDVALGLAKVQRLLE